MLLVLVLLVFQIKGRYHQGTVNTVVVSRWGVGVKFLIFHKKIAKVIDYSTSRELEQIGSNLEHS